MDTFKITLARNANGTYRVECGANITDEPYIIQRWIDDLHLAKDWLIQKQQENKDVV